MPRKIEISTLTSDACETTRTCEGVHALADRPAVYHVIVTEVTDPEELAAFAPYIGPGERLGTVRRPIIDEVPR